MAEKEEALNKKNATTTTTDRFHCQLLDGSKLPEELIKEEILPRVTSVKTLARFRCVSRSWGSLIHDIRFMKKTPLFSTIVSNSKLQLRHSSLLS